tara:strand:- start:272 stop:577 length:306 start_codon:yes stop_codon:yes gene_type:complete
MLIKRIEISNDVVLRVNPFELTCEPESLLHSISKAGASVNHCAEEKGESGSASCWQRGGMRTTNGDLSQPMRTPHVMRLARRLSPARPSFASVTSRPIQLL